MNRIVACFASESACYLTTGLPAAVCGVSARVGIRHFYLKKLLEIWMLFLQLMCCRFYEDPRVSNANVMNTNKMEFTKLGKK